MFVLKEILKPEMDAKIIVERSDGIVQITLNNPAKLNCMGSAMLKELDQAIELAEKDQDVRIVVMKGAGDRAFSTGADLKEFTSLSAEQTSDWLEYGNNIFDRIEMLPKPTVAMINGFAMGGGLELALACDFRLGTTSAIISSPELQHGWLPGWGGMMRLRRLIGEAKAKEVVMLNEKIPASQALNLGILTRILADGQEDQELKAFLKHLSSLKPEVFALAKKALMKAT